VAIVLLKGLFYDSRLVKGSLCVYRVNIQHYLITNSVAVIKSMLHLAYAMFASIISSLFIKYWTKIKWCTRALLLTLSGTYPRFRYQKMLYVIHVQTDSRRYHYCYSSITYNQSIRDRALMLKLAPNIFIYIQKTTSVIHSFELFAQKS